MSNITLTIGQGPVEVRIVVERDGGELVEVDWPANIV